MPYSLPFRTFCIWLKLFSKYSVIVDTQGGLGIVAGKPLTHATITDKKMARMQPCPAIVGPPVLSFATNGALLNVGNEHTVNSFFCPRMYEVTAGIVGCSQNKILKSCLPNKICRVLE